MAAGQARVTAAPGRATAWATAGGLSLAAQIALDDLADAWSDLYDLGYAGGEYHAFRLIGGPLITASTLAGLDSAIRADYARRRQQAGHAR